MNTGLIDMNGVEIKEGDYISLPYTDPLGTCYVEDGPEGHIRLKVVLDHGAFVAVDETNPEGISDAVSYHKTVLRDLVKTKSSNKYVSNYGVPDVFDGNTAVCWVVK